MAKSAATQAKERGRNAAEAPGELSREGVTEISNALRPLLADVFALYLKTKNFHWPMSGRHFRDYHLLLDEQAERLFAITDDFAESARKIGGSTLRSISDVSKHQRLKASNDTDLSPEMMLGELRGDNQKFTGYLRTAGVVCEKHKDVATTSLIEVWIDQSERRTWFLSEIVSGL